MIVAILPSYMQLSHIGSRWRVWRIFEAPDWWKVHWWQKWGKQISRFWCIFSCTIYCSCNIKKNNLHVAYFFAMHYFGKPFSMSITRLLFLFTFQMALLPEGITELLHHEQLPVPLVCSLHGICNIFFVSSGSWNSFGRRNIIHTKAVSTQLGFVSYWLNV